MDSSERGRQHRPASASRRRRPTSAPAGPQRGQIHPPQVDLNKASPLSSAPRWTVRSRPSSTPAAARTPGPGQYTLLRPDDYWCRRTPSFSMGKKTRTKSSSNPGPGEYAIDAERRGPKWKIGEAARRKEEVASHTPGPGSYDLPSCRSALSPSIGMPAFRLPQQQAFSSELSMGDIATPKYTTRHAIKFGTASRSVGIIESSPGPGDYEIGSSGLINKPRWSFGRCCDRVGKPESSDIGITSSQFV
mmetsp:Transcript_67241/g.105852  ORF Transcript_67241/g.105852 Transcript_67241/m.105852 type:complete len:247 (-) Transcript_67241:32-772(-)